MKQLAYSQNRPGLLVSVRSGEEAFTALEGGADVIDVKEPNRGSLGAADMSSIRDVVRAVNGRAPVTAAMGELVDLVATHNGSGSSTVPIGVSLFKTGLSHCDASIDWPAAWKRVIDANPNSRPVAVVYADWRAAQSPTPSDVLAAAVKFECPALLIDTWNKSTGSLFDHWPADDLREFLSQVRARNISVVLAGSLTEEGVRLAARLRPDLIAVRSAVCESGRNGTVCQRLVRNLAQAIAYAARTAKALDAV
jgi:uncharacterized protein (UPF0264 family)